MNRLKSLRQFALENTYCIDEFYYRFHKQYSGDFNGFDYLKYADCFYHAFANLTPVILDGELIVGGIGNNLNDIEKCEWEGIYKNITKNRCAFAGDGQDSHMAIDYELLLNYGINGIISRIEEYLKACAENKKDFYLAAQTCLKAIVKHSENYANHAEILATKEQDPSRKKELLRIAEICKNVPANPAKNFYEAVQSIHFVTYCLSLNPLRNNCQQFQLGRLDRYLISYYQQDVETGAITKEEAQLLLDCLGIQINMRVHSGLSSGYMVGGRDEKGNITANELTEMLMQVVDDIQLVYPAVGLCYADGMDDKYLLKACEILSHGRSHPAIFNDDIISKGLRDYGLSTWETCNYIHSTCVEITPIGMSNCWVASPYINMAQLLLDTMDQEYDSFETHFSTLLKKLDTIIKENFLDQNEKRKIRIENSMNPLLSCFVQDCLAEGLDIEKGGARYNWIMPSFVGMANLVDSLYVLKEVVYDKKEIGVCAFKEILGKNFEGYELWRQHLLNDLPKYGNDIDEVDCLFDVITKHIAEECKKYIPCHKNGRLIPSVFCWIMHEWFGTATGATPDGRLKGFPLGDGSGPCQGRELKGPTASILSATKWSHEKFIGGVAVNMKFSKSAIGENSISIMMALIKAYMKRGGFEMQINVIDKAILEKAIERPEEYSDLVVRIGGYSDYFTRLSKEMQQEILLRTEHKI